MSSAMPEPKKLHPLIGGCCCCGAIWIEATCTPLAKVCLSTDSASSISLRQLVATKPRLCISRHSMLILQRLCHCASCKKITGSAISTNGILPAFAIATYGTLQESRQLRPGGSGYARTSYFCPKCGTTMYSTNDNPMYAGIRIVKLGVFADWWEDAAEPGCGKDVLGEVMRRGAKEWAECAELDSEIHTYAKAGWCTIGGS